MDLVNPCHLGHVKNIDDDDDDDAEPEELRELGPPSSSAVGGFWCRYADRRLMTSDDLFDRPTT